MNKSLLLASILLTACDLGNLCTGGSSCSSGPAGPSVATPTPTPIQIVIPTPTPASGECDATSLVLSAPSEIAVKASVRLDVTPYHFGTVLPDSCNVGTRVLWINGPTTVCVLEGDVQGFNPMLRGVGVGDCNVTALIGNVSSGNFVVRVVK